MSPSSSPRASRTLRRYGARHLGVGIHHHRGRVGALAPPRRRRGCGPSPGLRRRAHGARQIGLGQRQIVLPPALRLKQRVVRGVDARVQLGQLVLLVQARDHHRPGRVRVLDRPVGAPDLLVADAGLGLEDLVVGLLLFERSTGGTSGARARRRATAGAAPGVRCCATPCRRDIRRPATGAGAPPATPSRRTRRARDNRTCAPAAGARPWR